MEITALGILGTLAIAIYPMMILMVISMFTIDILHGIRYTAKEAIRGTWYITAATTIIIGILWIITLGFRAILVTV